MHKLNFDRQVFRIIGSSATLHNIRPECEWIQIEMRIDIQRLRQTADRKDDTLREFHQLSQLVCAGATAALLQELYGIDNHQFCHLRKIFDLPACGRPKRIPDQCVQQVTRAIEETCMSRANGSWRFRTPNVDDYLSFTRKVPSVSLAEFHRHVDFN